MGLEICVVLGTRPEIIKFSPIIRECTRLGQDFFILHTGQHYSYGMDKVFFEQLELPEAKHNLDVGSGTHGEQTGKMLARALYLCKLQQESDIKLECCCSLGEPAGNELHTSDFHMPV